MAWAAMVATVATAGAAVASGVAAVLWWRVQPAWRPLAGQLIDPLPLASLTKALSERSVAWLDSHQSSDSDIADIPDSAIFVSRREP
jgi:hypothetical protein